MDGWEAVILPHTPADKANAKSVLKTSKSVSKLTPVPKEDPVLDSNTRGKALACRGEGHMERLVLSLLLGFVIGHQAAPVSAQAGASLPEGTPGCWFDDDGDGYGSAPDPKCGPGSVDNNIDCDDTNADINPGAVETIGNAIDENCNGTLACWLDQDGDLFGGNNSADAFMDCAEPGASTVNDDCDDSDSDIYPGAFDNPVDGVDANCDGFDYDLQADTDADTRSDGVEDTNHDGDVSNDDFDADSLADYLDVDDDNDSVLTAAELDEDTDGDGSPNYLDFDDDGDSVPTPNEDVEIVDGDPANDDTDADGLPNYLDADDDDDGLSTIEEDFNGNGDPTDDDTDGDGIPDYLDANVPRVHEDGFEDVQ